jgi:peptidoglycan/xylan/chitin deacetylase (PgdA/CDA1 family)
MYLTTAPWLLRKLFPSHLVWDIPNDSKKIYLTFDDGPHPVATPFVLDCLKEYNAKATFFCIGKNVEDYPEVYKRILDEGHRVGNHTHNHLSGKKTGDKEYFDDIVNAAQIIDSSLFRPPYGEITAFQANSLQAKFKIIMWTVLSADFDIKITGEKCLQNVVKNTKTGSIIVFHDSEKAFKRLEYALPKALQQFSEKGYVMEALKL